jgi:hypothetical protein
MSPTPLQHINALAEGYAKKRAWLDEITTEIDDAQRAVLRMHKRRLTAAHAGAAEAFLELHTGIANNPQLFEKPRTFIVHGIKIGYQKQKGKVVIADEAKTIALIRKHLGEDAAATLIKTVESVIKPAAANLSASDLKRTGIELTADTDKVVISSVDSDLDKLIDRLLEEAAKEES